MYIPIADSLASSINSVIQRGMPTVLSVVLHTVRHPQQIPPQHKVHIYTEYHIVCSLVGFGTLPPLLSPASVPLPSEPKGGAHSPAGEGVGESQFRRLEKKLSTLPTLCSIGSDACFSVVALGVKWGGGGGVLPSVVISPVEWTSLWRPRDRKKLEIFDQNIGFYHFWSSKPCIRIRNTGTFQ
jgi:hypothetical protein